MRDLMTFNSYTVRVFENNQENFDTFYDLALNAANRVYDTYSKKDTENMLRTQFDAILGITKEMTPMKRRQAWRKNAPEFYSVIEDIVVDKMVSGWPDDPFFTRYCETRNLAVGDKNEFTVEENSLLQVSEFAGNHHDVDYYSVRVA